MKKNIVVLNKPGGEKESLYYNYLFDLGFKVLIESSLKTTFLLPLGWSADTVENLMVLKDENSNVRMGVKFGIFHLHTRYSVVIKRLSKPTHPFETDYVCVFDNKKNSVVKLYGYVEPYTDEHYILQYSAHQYLNRLYPNWENPCKYWDED